MICLPEAGHACTALPQASVGQFLMEIKEGIGANRNLTTQPRQIDGLLGQCLSGELRSEFQPYTYRHARRGPHSMRRYTITLGAPTTSGGKVISASSDGRIDGAAIALEGDLVTCPVCKTAGKILCVGPRIPETWGGKSVALENDLCICRCATHPRLQPNQTLRCQVIKDTGRALSNPWSGPAQRPAAGPAFSERFVLVDDHNGVPLPSREYAVVRACGKLEFGTSDAAGQTHLLSATAQSECVEIYAQGAMMTASLISPSGVVLHHRARRRTTPAAETLPKEVRLQGLQQGPRLADAASGEVVAFLPEDDACDRAP